MRISKVAFKYAQSLLQITIDQHALETVSKEIEFIAKTLKDFPRVAKLLKNPVMKLEIKMGVLHDIFASRLSEHTMRFLNFLGEKDRIALLGEIIEAFYIKRNEHLGIVTVSVSTASDFSKEQEESLSSRIAVVTGLKPELTVSTDAGLIGGFVARVGDTVFDASLRHQLERLRTRFMNSSISVQ